jgi:uncharacterized membrane protein (DUF485 family)
MKRFIKRPSLTEWLFGVVIIVALQISALVVYLLLRLLTGNDSSKLAWASISQVVILLVGIAILPVIVFRCTRFFVRVASRRLFRQNQQIRYNAPA